MSIDEQYACELRDPRNFTSFKLLVERPASERAAVVAALAAIGGTLEEPYAWIPADWLRQQPTLATDTAWQQDLQNMLDYAARKGWVDVARGWVRAHIDWHPISA